MDFYSGELHSSPSFSSISIITTYPFIVLLHHLADFNQCMVQCFTELKGNVCPRRWCVRRGSLLQDGLPVKSKDVNLKIRSSGMKFS